MNNNLQQRLDAFVTGQSSPVALAAELSAQVDATPSAAWEVLALVDQYHRRGKLPMDLYRSLTFAIKRRALGLHVPELRIVPRTDGGRGAAVDAAVPTAGAGEPAREILELREQLQAARERAALYLEQLQSGEWQRRRPVPPAHDPWWRARGWRTRPVHCVAALAFVAAVTMAPGAGDRALDAGVARLRVAVARAPVAPVPVPGHLSFSADRYIAYAGSGRVELSVKRSGGTDGAVSFRWSAQGAGARAGTDFRAPGAHKITLPAGVDAVQWSVPVLQNAQRRHTEMFYVSIAKADGGATLGEITRATVFIMGR